MQAAMGVQGSCISGSTCHAPQLPALTPHAPALCSHKWLNACMHHVQELRAQIASGGVSCMAVFASMGSMGGGAGMADLYDLLAKGIDVSEKPGVQAKGIGVVWHG